jgi:DNA-binding transcriptional MerR regulator
MSQRLYFQTENQSLAYILAELGEKIGVQNIYDKERLREIGVGTIKDAITRAKNSSQPWKLRGRVIYTFHDSERLQRLIRAYNDGFSAAGNGESLKLDEMDDTSAAWLYGYFTARTKQFSREWINCTPQYYERKRGDVQRIENAKTGEVRMSMPGFKLVPVNLNEDQRRHIGL